MSRILIQDGNDTVLVEKLQIAESAPDRMKGLLGLTDLSQDSGLLLRPCRSIHMWGMRFAIDAAFLDRDMKILKIARNLRPWQLAFAPPKTYCVLETAAGTLTHLNRSDQLEIQ